MNCPSFGPSPGTIKFADQLWQAGHRQRTLWKVADTAIWTYPCSKVHCDRVAMSGLVEGWEKLVDAMVATVKTLPDYANRTEGWNLGDELLAEVPLIGSEHCTAKLARPLNLDMQGIPLVNVTAVARRIRQQFGVAKTFIYWNETPYAFTRNASLPNQPCTGTARCAARCVTSHQCLIFGSYTHAPCLCNLFFKNHRCIQDDSVF